MSTPSPIPGMPTGQSKFQYNFPPLPDNQQPIAWTVLGVLTLGILGFYMNSLLPVSEQWNTPQYSHGWLIPIFSIALLWWRHEIWRDVPTSHRVLGFCIILAGIAMRMAGTIYIRFTIENLSLIVVLIGAFVLVGGLPTLRWAGPAIAFLVFMFPLPDAAYDRVVRPLKQVATMASHYALETLGVACVREGNIIQLASDSKLGVEDACSGLRMLTIFIALAFGVAMISTNRPMWERILIVLSSAPIALAVNVIRITLTGLMYNMNFSSKVADLVMHDVAGWIMMPMALGLLYLETRFLASIVIEDEHASGPNFSMSGVSSPVGKPETPTLPDGTAS